MNALRRRAIAALVALVGARAFAQNRPPRWLMISVRQERAPAFTSDARAPHGSVVTDSRSASATGSNDGSRVVRARATESKVRVLEGARVPIHFEAAVPMTFRHFAIGKEGVEEIRGSVSYDALVQFIVRPRLAGSAVTLEIEPHDSALVSGQDERGRLSTTAHGHLGDWIAVGGADLRDESDARQSLDAGLRAQTRTTTDQRGVWLKVELDDAGAR